MFDRDEKQFLINKRILDKERLKKNLYDQIEEKKKIKEEELKIKVKKYTYDRNFNI